MYKAEEQVFKSECFGYRESSALFKKSFKLTVVYQTNQEQGKCDSKNMNGAR